MDKRRLRGEQKQGGTARAAKTAAARSFAFEAADAPAYEMGQRELLRASAADRGGKRVIKPRDRLRLHATTKEREYKSDIHLRAARSELQRVKRKLEQFMHVHFSSMRELVSKLDRDHDGEISMSEWLSGLKEYNFPVTEEEGRLLFRYIDEDGSDGLSFSELSWIFSPASLASLPQPEELRKNARLLADMEGFKYFSHAQQSQLADEDAFTPRGSHKGRLKDAQEATRLAQKVQLKDGDLPYPFSNVGIVDLGDPADDPEPRVDELMKRRPRNREEEIDLLRMACAHKLGRLGGEMFRVMHRFDTHDRGYLTPAQFLACARDPENGFDLGLSRREERLLLEELLTEGDVVEPLTLETFLHSALPERTTAQQLDADARRRLEILQARLDADRLKDPERQARAEAKARGRALAQRRVKDNESKLEEWRRPREEQKARASRVRPGELEEPLPTHPGLATQAAGPSAQRQQQIQLTTGKRTGVTGDEPESPREQRVGERLRRKHERRRARAATAADVDYDPGDSSDSDNTEEEGEGVGGGMVGREPTLDHGDDPDLGFADTRSPADTTGLPTSGRLAATTTGTASAARALSLRQLAPPREALRATQALLPRRNTNAARADGLFHMGRPRQRSQHTTSSQGLLAVLGGDARTAAGLSAVGAARLDDRRRLLLGRAAATQLAASTTKEELISTAGLGNLSGRASSARRAQRALRKVAGASTRAALPRPMSLPGIAPRVQAGAAPDSLAVACGAGPGRRRLLFDPMARDPSSPVAAHASVVRRMTVDGLDAQTAVQTAMDRSALGRSLGAGNAELATTGGMLHRSAMQRLSASTASLPASTTASGMGLQSVSRSQRRRLERTAMALEEAKRVRRTTRVSRRPRGGAAIGGGASSSLSPDAQARGFMSDRERFVRKSLMKPGEFEASVRFDGAPVDGAAATVRQQQQSITQSLERPPLARRTLPGGPGMTPGVQMMLARTRELESATEEDPDLRAASDEEDGPVRTGRDLGMVLSASGGALPPVGGRWKGGTRSLTRAARAREAEARILGQYRREVEEQDRVAEGRAVARAAQRLQYERRVANASGRFNSLFGKQTDNLREAYMSR